MQTNAQKIRLAAQKVAGGTGKTAVAVCSAIRNFLAELHSLITVLAAGADAALGIVIVIPDFDPVYAFPEYSGE